MALILFYINETRTQPSSANATHFIISQRTLMPSSSSQFPFPFPFPFPIHPPNLWLLGMGGGFMGERIY